MVIRWLLASLLLLAIGLGAAVLLEANRGTLPIEPPGDLLLEPAPLSGQAPEFALPGIGDPASTSLGTFRGRFVLLNFWATWCEPCKAELPHLAAMARALEPLPIQVVLVSVDEGPTPVLSLAAELGQAGLLDAARLIRGERKNVTSLLDIRQTTPAAYGTSKYPETYLIDKSGSLRLKFIGPKPWSRKGAIGLIEGAVSKAS